MTTDYSAYMKPLQQFRLVPGLAGLGRHIGFANSNGIMVLALILVWALLWFGMRKKALIPGRLQVLAEMLYEFILNMCSDTIGKEGKKFFPFVFTLFMFILLGNLLGLFPYFFAFTSHLAVTALLALMVFVLSIAVGLWYHGFRFFTIFVPKDAPKAIYPLLIPIEIVSYLSRPVSLSVRLFANITAGHIMWEVFAGFILMLTLAFGVWGGIMSAGPYLMNVVLAGFELLIAFLQAYVFAILTCIYLRDSVQLH